MDERDAMWENNKKLRAKESKEGKKEVKTKNKTTKQQKTKTKDKNKNKNKNKKEKEKEKEKRMRENVAEIGACINRSCFPFSWWSHSL